VYTGERADVFAGRDVIHADGVPVAVGTEHVLGADGRRQPHHLVVIVQDRHGRHQGRTGVRQRWVGVREGRASRPGPGEGPAARWSEARQAAARTSRTTPCTAGPMAPRIADTILHASNSQCVNKRQLTY